MPLSLLFALQHVHDALLRTDGEEAVVGRIGADILAALDGVAASTGSACHSGSVDLSPVLRAMGVPPEEGMGALRFSLGRGTTEAEIREVAERLDGALVAGVGASVGEG